MNEREMETRVAVVTGGGRGVGRAIAEALAASGTAVALVARSETELRDVATVIGDRGGMALPLIADVTRPSVVDEIAARVERELGPIKLLVNVAGTCGAIGPIWEVDAEMWRRDIENNLLSTFLCARAVIPGMLGRGEGRIINVSSYAANRAAPNISAYGAAKAAVAHLTNTLAFETRGSGISVFAITPGTVRTAMTRLMTDSRAGRKWLPQIPEDRWLPPERAAELVLFLASGRGDRLSGRFLHVLDDVESLVRRADEIEHEDLYVLRLRKQPETTGR